MGWAPLDKLSVVVPFSSEGPRAHCWCLAPLSSAATAAGGSGGPPQQHHTSSQGHWCLKVWLLSWTAIATSSSLR